MALFINKTIIKMRQFITLLSLEESRKVKLIFFLFYFNNKTVKYYTILFIIKSRKKNCVILDCIALKYHLKQIYGKSKAININEWKGKTNQCYKLKLIIGKKLIYFSHLLTEVIHLSIHYICRKILT